MFFRKLLQEQGVLIEPENVDNDLEEEGVNRFSGMNAEDADEYIKSHVEIEVTDEDPDLSLFQKKALTMTNVTKNGMVKKRILKHGLECDGLVPERAAVTIHYSCCVEDFDEPYDSTYMRGRPEKHRIGSGHLLPGLEIAISSMKKEEKSEFLIDPQEAFGEMGCPPRIPKNAQIFAKIELLDFSEEGESEAMLALPPDERNKQYNFKQTLDVARKEHKIGNDYHKIKEYKLAAKCYERGSRLLEDVEMANDEEEKIQKRLLKKLQCNRGYCYLQSNWPKKACLALQDAEKINDTADKELDAKIYYRLGLAKKKLANFKDAMDFLKRARQLKPCDPAIGNEISLIDRLIAKERTESKAMCQRMIGKNFQKPSPPPFMKNKYDDEDYAEVIEALESFKMDQTQNEFILPSGMESLHGLVQQVSCELNLSFEKSHIGRGPQYKVVKPK